MNFPYKYDDCKHGIFQYLLALQIHKVTIVNFDFAGAEAASSFHEGV